MFKVDDGANEVVVVGAERLASHCVETFAGKPVDICSYVCVEIYGIGEGGESEENTWRPRRGICAWSYL